MGNLAAVIAERPREGDLTWIFGSSRSGSTWLLRMLTEFDELLPIDETGIGHHLGVWRPIPLAWATCDDPPELSTFRTVKGSNPDYFFSDEHRDGWEPLLRDFVLDRLALQRDGDRRFVIKEPGGSQVADWVMSLLPGSRLVFLLRDGRDVVDSWLDAYQDGGWITEDGGFPVAPHGRVAFIKWQATVWRYRTEATQRAYDAHAPDRRVLVRYEELLADPARELGRVLETIGLRVAPERVEEVAAKHAYEKVPAHERGAGKFVRSASPGSWCERLSGEEQEALLDVLGDSVRRFGYRTG
ncbi:MAG TPA: sulfotransferase [Solirubrobacteraceae bacterium]|nr:sulfotransferase [Solirubrobacteraceae bacterium]